MERAWAVFNHLKSEIEKPDAICYSLMISACARTRDAEKALDLLNEMNDYHIDPTTTTFNNLIRYTFVLMVLTIVVERAVCDKIITWKLSICYRK